MKRVWGETEFSCRNKAEEFPACSDEEFREALALANASFYKWRVPESEWYRVTIDGKPLQYWLNKLEEEKTCG